MEKSKSLIFARVATLLEMVVSIISFIFCQLYASSSIKIETKVESGQLLFTYQDNGKGLDLDKWRAASNSVGFKSIEQRLMILKGTSKIEKVKTGFKIKFKIPIS